ncbi:MAG: NFACT RNA binding domain-containing protein [Desulfoplanes sp.]|nr:NFACT RNA binding domain-containing protein [Desulfoplanes sp.]
MEANFFRFAALELRKRIAGLRIEKIFDPAPRAFTIDVGAAGYVIFYASPSRGFFFLSTVKPDNKRQPSGQVMWLRKRIRSRRILDIQIDWPGRRMAWRIGVQPPSYLVFNLREGLQIMDHLDEGFGREPEWPDIDQVRDGSNIWERFPQMSPPLRHLLATISPDRGREILDALKTGDHKGGFWVAGRGTETRLSLWQPEKGESLAFGTALEAAEAYGFPRVSSMVNEDVEIERQRSKKIKRLKKSLKRLEQDEQRLLTMVKGRDKGNLVLAHLYQLDGSRRMESIALDDGLGQTMVVDLNPAKTLLENMQWFFSRAKKGERGLPVIRERREYLERQCAAVANADMAVASPREPSEAAVAPKKMSIPKKYRTLAVHMYRTDDHFLLIRGKNQKANHQLLTQLASPLDYWFHAQDGPGAHVILKRDFEAQDVPRRSIEQAAIIAALSSWQRGTDKARVLCAQVRDVRTIKGAALGRVQVGQVRESVVVVMDQELEDRLKIDG